MGHKPFCGLRLVLEVRGRVANIRAAANEAFPAASDVSNVRGWAVGPPYSMFGPKGLQRALGGLIARLGSLMAKSVQ